MPQKEKKQGLSTKVGRRFKAVTEEIGRPVSQLVVQVKEPAPVVAKETKPVELVQPKESIKPVANPEEEARKLVESFGVKETNNITPGQKAASKKNILFFLGVMLLVAFVVMALAGGLYVYLNGVRNLSSGQAETILPTYVPSATPTVSPTLSPSATAKPDYSLFNVSILNGNGAIGAATAVRDLIQKGGFKVSYIGNADNFNFTDTIVQVKNNVSPDVVATLRSFLVPTYSVKIGSQLNPQQRFDIIITVGSK